MLIDLKAGWRDAGTQLEETTNSVSRPHSCKSKGVTQSLFLNYYLIIIVLFSIQTTVNLLLPHSVLNQHWFIGNG